MTVVADGIDLGASDLERYRHLRRIVENALADPDPTGSRRAGAGATTRTSCAR